MSNLDLNNHSDRQIVKALLSLRIDKFFSVMNAISAIATRMEKRGRLIAKDNSDEEIESLIKRLFEGDKYE